MNRPMLLMVIALIMTTPCRAESPDLRYRFTPGQHLVYEHENRSVGYGRWERFEVWVLGEWDTGGWDMLLHQSSGYLLNVQPVKVPDDLALMRFTLLPDGTIPPDRGFSFQIDPRRLFPMLPDAEAAKWEHIDPNYGNKTSYTIVPNDGPGTTLIGVGVQNDTDDIFGVSRELTIHFDRDSGLMTRAEGTTKHAGHAKRDSVGTTELVFNEQLDAGALVEIRREAEHYLDAKRAYAEAATRAAELHNAEPGMGVALTELGEAKAGAASPLFIGLFEQLVGRHESRKEDLIVSARQKAEIINLPAGDWTLKDLGGNEHALKDYRGKVVILDFWYRRCAWCIRAMPQVNRAADYFKDKPVVVFGMNTDTVLDDAVFVHKKMGLRYPSLLAADTPSLYRVDSFPTLIVIDPAGVVRGYHVCYSPTMYGDLVAEVEALLVKTPR